MKKLMRLKPISIMILCILFFGHNAYTQLDNVETKVEEYLGKEKFELFQTSNPGLIQFLKKKSTHGFLIEDVSETKSNVLPKLGKVLYQEKEISLEAFYEATKSNDFNFLQYSFPDIDNGTFLLSKSENRMITIYSDRIINQLVNKDN
ncbi:hypothetical protein [Brumimicrobium aurantiacum]|uniref:DUF4252 domain-containing protein n=1 Tax=Brumimicrobium aurantiacum TaxID=1737063 RepID=A0A3E1EVR8_9FLAO|nr:hypothetical protein [Brumimicrobium aurantiacum]RFC53656.1 hypothetical protein DXU93_11035 [Brumimicrobium aurantiacum]